MRIRQGQYKIGTHVSTPDGNGIIRRNEKWSFRQGVKIEKIRGLRFYYPNQMKVINV